MKHATAPQMLRWILQTAQELNTDWAAAGGLEEHCFHLHADLRRLKEIHAALDSLLADCEHERDYQRSTPDS